MDKPLRCAIIGQNPMRFPWGFDEEDDRCRKLKIELAQQIMALRQSGVSQFLTACDSGVGLYAAEIVNGLRTTDHDLMLICYTPHEEQATKWAPYLRERYFTMLEKCTLIFTVCEVGAPDGQRREGQEESRERIRQADSLQEDHRPDGRGAGGL